MEKGIYEKGSILRTYTVASGQTPAIGNTVYISADGQISTAGTGQTGLVGVVVDVRFRGEYTQFPGGAYVDPYTAKAGDEVTVCIGGLVTVATYGTPSIGDLVQTYTGGLVTDLTLPTDTATNLAAAIPKAKGRFVKVDNTNHVAQIYLQQ